MGTYDAFQRVFPLAKMYQYLPGSRHNVLCFLLGDSPASEILYANVSEHCLFHLPAYEEGTDSVRKRWHTKFRRQGIAQ
jgi:hypothetical protein